MSTHSPNIIQFPATPNPSSSMDPTDEELGPYAQRKLDEVREKTPSTKLTVEALLRRPAIREGFAKQFKEDQERQRQADEAALEAELAAVEAEFAPPQPSVPATTTLKVAPITKIAPSNDPEIPLQVERCRERMVNVFPGCVFEQPEAAAAMRYHLVKSIKTVSNLMEQHQDGNSRYMQLLRKRYSDLQQFIDLINQVIVAWGENPKIFRADWEMISYVRDLSDRPEFCHLLNIPTEADARRLEEEESVAQKLQQRREVLCPLIDNLLTQAGCTSGVEKMADRLVRKYGELNDPQVILCEAAVDKTLEARSDDDKSAAKLYATAAGMTDEELEKAVAEKSAKLAQPTSNKKVDRKKDRRERDQAIRTQMKGQKRNDDSNIKKGNKKK